ncbi:restriction endonuclease subunit S [Peptacetobacter sp.]|uniref:restriction endonuclease subunit S n=1 Tax=Peptacetobacter sp. TaxID=2991975 RepID=UPI003AB82EBD
MENSVEKLIEKINFEKEKAIENGIIRKEKPQKEISDREKYCKLPDNWRWIRLGDYCLKATDYVASGSFASIKENVNYYNTENYAIMVKTADFANNFTKNLTYTDESSYKFLSNSNLFGGELILSNIGSIGKVFKVPYLNKPMTLASNTIMIKFTDDKLADYMYYYFKSNYGQNAIKSISSGTSMLKFNKTQLKTLPIPIPSIEIQEKIVTALDKAQHLIDKKKEQIELLDELVKSRFIEMFGDPVNNPKSFEILTIGDLTTDVKYGTSKSSSEGGKYPYLRMNNITYGGKLDLNDLKYIDIDDDELEKCIVKRGDVLFNRTNSIELIGKTCIFELEEPMVIAGYIIRVRLKNNILPVYLSTFLNSSYGKTLLRGIAKGAVNQANINAQELKSIKIHVPPIELQNEFAEFVKKVDSIRSKMEASLSELEDNFNSLMQKAFKGELF